MRAVEEEDEVEGGIVTDIFVKDGCYQLCITHNGVENIQALSADDWCEACAQAEAIVADYRRRIC